MFGAMQRVWSGWALGLRDFWSNLTTVLQSSSVRAPQSIVYGSMFLYGIYALIFDEPLSHVDNDMGHVAAVVWDWCHVFGVLMVFVGWWMSRPGPGDGTRSKRVANGLILTAAGNFTMFLVICAYQAAHFHGSGHPLWEHSMFMYTSIGLGILAIFCSDVSEIRTRVDVRKLDLRRER